MALQASRAVEGKRGRGKKKRESKLGAAQFGICGLNGPFVGIFVCVSVCECSQHKFINVRCSFEYPLHLPPTILSPRHLYNAAAAPDCSPLCCAHFCCCLFKQSNLVFIRTPQQQQQQSQMLSVSSRYICIYCTVVSYPTLAR